MKVLFVTNSSELGGATTALLNIFPYLRKKGIKPCVTFERIGTTALILDKMGIQYFPISNVLEIYPSIGNFKDLVKFPYRIIKMCMLTYLAYRRLCRIVEQIKPDIIHTNVGPIHIGYRVAKKYGIPHVWHLREYQVEDFNMHPFPSYKNFIDKIHSSDNHCIAITKEIFNHFNLLKDKDIMLYDGVVNSNNMQPVNNNKDRALLFVGRLEDAKGIKDLLSAYNIYRNQGGEMDLYVAGKGEKTYVAECMEMLSPKNKRTVHILGFREDVPFLMSKYYALVVPSRSEGFGFITAEAMFNGCLVIGRNTGGTKEQFDNGLNLFGREIAVRFTTNKDLLDALFAVERMNDAEYRGYIESAQLASYTLYDAEKQAISLCNVYRKVMNVAKA